MRKLINTIAFCSCLPGIAIAFPVMAEEIEHKNTIDLPPEVIENSPVLQDWLEEIPNVLEDIQKNPAFNTRFQIGFTIFPSNDDAGGINLGIEDIFIGNSGITLSGDYQTAFNGSRNALGADLNYFILPLGSYINFAPLLGYRYLQSNNFFTDGVRVGLRLMLALSRTGGGDISLSQSFVSPGGDREVGITSLSVGYAIAAYWRISTDLEWQNSLEGKDNRFSLGLEWQF